MMDVFTHTKPYFLLTFFLFSIAPSDGQAAAGAGLAHPEDTSAAKTSVTSKRPDTNIIDDLPFYGPSPAPSTVTRTSSGQSQASSCPDRSGNFSVVYAGTPTAVVGLDTTVIDACAASAVRTLESNASEDAIAHTIPPATVTLPAPATIIFDMYSPSDLCASCATAMAGGFFDPYTRSVGRGPDFFDNPATASTAAFLEPGPTHVRLHQGPISNSVTSGAFDFSAMRDTQEFLG